MPTLQDQEQKNTDPLNPGDVHAGDQFNQQQATARELADIEKNYGADGDPTQENANVANANKRLSDDASPIGAAEADAGWKSTVGQGGGKQKITGKGNFLKKKGPLSAIIALFFGGGFAGFMLFSPGVALVQFKEVLMGDLNDQVRAMDTLDATLMRSKLGSVQSGLCNQKLPSIGCRFSTMSEKEVQRFRNAEIQIEPDEPDRNFKRTKPTKLIFPDGTEITDPNQLRAYLRENPSGLSAMRKAFNPKFSGMYDEVARRVFANFRTDRTQKVKGNTEAERNKSVNAATAGEAAGIDAKGYRTDEEGRQYVLNREGNPVYPEGTSNVPAGGIVNQGQFDSLVGENVALLDRLQSAASGTSAGNAFGKLLSSGMRGVNVFGTGDTMCTIYNTARAVSAAAKITRAVQLVQYFVVFANVADRIKAGVAGPEEVEWAGNRVTAVDTREMIVDESSERTSNDPNTAEAVARENPYYGANAFDSAGYHVAAYNDAPILTSQDMQFLVGGAMVGRLSTVLDQVAKFFGGRDNVRGSCKVLQSWWVRGAGLVVGVVSAVGSFGVTAALGVGASVAMGFAMPFLESMLADIIAGKTVTSATKGVDTGNASFAGAAALFGSLAGGHGMTPANSKELKAYYAATESTHQERIAAEKLEAQDTPFDVYNEHSFLGSFVRSINPTVIKSTASVSGALQNIPSLFGTAISSIIPSVGAQTNSFNPERFQRCTTDEGYIDLGIDADVFCNVRYALTPKQLQMQPGPTERYMYNNGHIEEDGAAKSNEYKDWVKYCAKRTDGLGESGDADDANSDAAIGKICVRKDKSAKELEDLDNFGVYYMYFVLQESRDAGGYDGDTAFYNDMYANDSQLANSGASYAW